MLATRFGNGLAGFDALTREFDRLFDQSTRAVGRSSVTVAPVSLWDNDQHVYLEIDLPGFKQDEIELTLHDGRLLVRGERKRPEYEAKCWYDERSYGGFERVISLSDMVDPNQIEAELSDGVLRVTLTKRPEHQPQRIAINARQEDAKRIES